MVRLRGVKAMCEDCISLMDFFLLLKPPFCLNSLVFSVVDEELEGHSGLFILSDTIVVVEQLQLHFTFLWDTKG